MIEPVGVNGWQDMVLLGWLQGTPLRWASVIVAVEPTGVDLDEVEQVTFTYYDRDGEPHVAVVNGTDLDDLRRFYDDADYPLQA